MQKFDFTVKKTRGKYLRIQIKPGGIVEIFKPKLFPMFLVSKFLKQKESWILDKIEKQKKNKSIKNSRKDYLINKEDARKIVLEKLDFWKNFYYENFGVNFTWNKVAIKNAETRWGSCSSKKNLNFSYKIVFLSPETQDYLIVHELSHLIFLDHSENFWKLVEKGIPNWKKLRKLLKNNEDLQNFPQVV